MRTQTPLLKARALSVPLLALGLLALPAAARGGNGALPESVQFTTGDGQTLRGTFYRPKTRSPGVILLHDAGATRAQLEPLAGRLQKQGFGVLTVDLRGHGDSKSSKLDWNKLSESDRKTTWSFAPRDVVAAADWLAEQPDIHNTSLSLVGYGAGCALAVRHAKSDENVVCMALLAPNTEDYGFDVRADIQTLEGLPTYVITSKNDEAELMAQEANASSGTTYVDLFISPARLATPLEDKGLPTRVSKWLSDKAMLKKGRSSGKR